MKKRLSKPSLVKKLDKIFSKFIRLRDQKNGLIKCVSCESVIYWKEAHNCHFMSRGNYLYRRDEKNCHSGCCSCNTYNQERHMQNYTLFMIDTYGRELVHEMLANKRTVANIKTYELQEKIEYYTPLVKEMEAKLNSKRLFPDK